MVNDQNEFSFKIKQGYKQGKKEAPFWFKNSRLETFLKNIFRITIRVSNSLDPDQARCFVCFFCKGYQQTTLVGKEFMQRQNLLKIKGGVIQKIYFWRIPS